MSPNSAANVRAMSALPLKADIAVRFDNLVKFNCKIKEGAVGPGGLEPPTRPL